MSLVTRDPATGLRRGPIIYPDGRPPVPFGCRWCGIEKGGHGWQSKAGVGLHTWVQPTNAQILARMRARRNARLNAQSAYHVTTGWAPDLDGESADPYCADCGTPACPRWERLHIRIHLRRQGLRRWPRTGGQSAGGWGGSSPAPDANDPF